MARVSTLSPTKIKRLRELRDPRRPGGALSLRAAASELGISHQTVSDWEKKHRVSARRVKRESRTAAKVGAALEALATTKPTGLEDVRKRATLIREMLKKLAPAVQKEEYPATNFVTLAKYADELARLEVELSPPAPKDPDKDEQTIEAEAKLMAKLEQMIADAEARAHRR
jgi:transcriptional regulator with XRE-family HTH domain